MLSQSQYDLAGELVVQTNALGGRTAITEGSDPATGGLIRINTHPDGGTRIEAFYLDGSPKRTTGTAVQPMGFGHGVEYVVGVLHSVSTQTNLNADGTLTSEWIKTYTDAAGRVVKTVYAPGTTSSQSFYNAKGQLERQVDPDVSYFPFRSFLCRFSK